jgi:hypothetical protein
MLSCFEIRKERSGPFVPNDIRYEVCRFAKHVWSLVRNAKEKLNMAEIFNQFYSNFDLLLIEKRQGPA